MMKTMLGTVTVALSLLVGQVAVAAEKGSADDAVAMVKKGGALIKSVGKEKAFAAFADPANKDFHDRDLYLYVYDLKGIALAHGNNPKMVGKNLIDIKDTDGKLMIREMIEVANTKGKGWVDFKWPNPTTKAMEQKSGYLEKVDDMMVGSGIYK
jgi:signal transduction histidine kinase